MYRGFLIPHVICLVLTICAGEAAANSDGRRESEPRHSLEDTFKRLANKDTTIAWPAATELAKAATRDPAVLARLVGLLQNSDDTVRRSAVLALASTGQPAILSLLAVSHSPNATPRSAAADALGQMGEAGLAGVPRLIELLSDDNANVRLKAAWSLRRLHQPTNLYLPILTNLLKDPQDVHALAAMHYLGTMGAVARPAVPALKKLLDKGNSVDTRCFAAAALLRIGQMREAMAVLEELLQSPDESTRGSVLFELGLMGDDAAPAVPALATLLASKDGNERSNVAGILMQVGPAARQAIPALLKALADSDPSVRSAAATAIGKIDPKAPGAVPALTGLLKDQDADVRSSAAWALGRAGTVARGVAQALLPLLHDSDRNVRLTALRTLAEINPAPQEVVPALTATLSEKGSPSTAALAAWALGQMGTPANAAVPLLKVAVREWTGRERAVAALALWRIDHERSPSLEELAAQIQHPHSAGRPAALHAIAQIGPVGKRYLPAVRAALTDKDPLTRVAAAEALWRLSHEAQRARAVLLDVLGGLDERAARYALDVIASMGSEARPALPRLREIAIIYEADKAARRYFARCLKNMEAGKTMPVNDDLLWP